ncbi:MULTISPECIES: TIGR00725 family protein [unclassified Pseudactinotalea]|uniref:TIGR00725 family protein n=1 Tax=unclassified Pseudactinotalea TaxID=2649176 RepID=UPI00128E5027|nr:MULTISPECIES: TIGR00725 family protein [unclassified Pseudactinotalea]MPV51105.1 TIGR00725 family protein [Pseudactinotalea sp. HY160]QGH70299.1 TIGR00725 family protein [Pseudactinotalea sp. HY158]
MRRTTIGVLGNAAPAGTQLPPGLLDLAAEVGRSIARSDAVLLSGGTDGVMAAASRGAQEAGGFTVGFLPYADHEHANQYLDLSLPTGMGTIRNFLTARCADAVIVVGGGVGTLNEITIAYDAGTPIVALAGSGGWADRIRPNLIDDQWIDARQVTPISFAATPQEAAQIALARSREERLGSRLSALTGAAGH